MLIMLFFCKSKPKIILYFLKILNKASQMSGMEVAAKKLRFWNKIVSIDAQNQVIWSVAMNFGVKIKSFQLLFEIWHKIMSSNRDFRPDSIENGDESYSSSEESLSNCCAISVNTKVQELQQSFENLKQFVTKLSVEKVGLFEKEMIAYSDKEELLLKSPEQILKLCEKRIQKMLRNKKTKKNWNEKDIDILVWILNKYSSFYAKKSVHALDESDWKFISKLIPATSWKKCMFKWLSLKKFSLMVFKWSKEESDLLAHFIKKFGKKDWKKLSELLYIQNSSNKKIFRTPKQCREHWNCYANPLIKKGPWQPNEDIKLLENVLQLNCMKKWSEVAKNIKGRTENAVKNRFSLLLQKQKKKTGEENEKNLINKILLDLMNEDHVFQNGMLSEDLEQLEAPNEIFESESPVSIRNQSRDENAQQKRTSSILEQPKQEKKTLRNIVIPNFIQNEPIYQPAQYFSIFPGYTPYFFGFVYEGNFQMN